MIKKHLSTILLVLILLVGVGLLAYPTVSDWWNSFHQSRAIASYTDSVSTLSQVDYDQLWDGAAAYNAALVEKTNPFILSEEEQAAYASQLDISGSGVMGYINIEKIKCTLPIYHGTDEAVLQVAVGHIEGSSLPVGGESTHCVLSGHRGLPSAKLFTNLDQMELGDVFELDILDATLTYEVDQIRIVEPHELDNLVIEPGQDYCTLVTCTPYGINSHRLLVRGHRIENLASASSVHITADALKIDPVLVAPVAAAPMLLLLLVGLLASSHWKKKF